MDPQIAAVGIGLAVTLIFAEMFGLAAGGMIVPGYFALSLGDPQAVGLTILVALLTWGIVRGLSQVIILYGRRRVALMVLIGFVLGQMVDSLTMSHFGQTLPIIGMIVPGLIALWIERQGAVETLSVLCICAVVVRLTLIAVGLEVTA